MFGGGVVLHPVTKAGRLETVSTGGGMSGGFIIHAAPPGSPRRGGGTPPPPPVHSAAVETAPSPSPSSVALNQSRGKGRVHLRTLEEAWLRPLLLGLPVIYGLSPQP